MRHLWVFAVRKEGWGGEVARRGNMQSTGGSLTSLIESGRYKLVKAILVAHRRSMERVPTKQLLWPRRSSAIGAVHSALAFQRLLLFFSAGIRASRPLIQAMY
jgi:hypothetical protein